MTPDEALEHIHTTMQAWARHEFDGTEAIARVLETLEAAGRPLIGKVDLIEPDNDEG